MHLSARRNRPFAAAQGDTREIRQEDNTVLLSPFVALRVNSVMHLEAQRERPFAAAQKLCPERSEWGDIERHLRLIRIGADKSAVTR